MKSSDIIILCILHVHIYRYLFNNVLNRIFRVTIYIGARNKDLEFRWKNALEK